MRKRWLQVLHEIFPKDKRLVFIGSDLSADPALKKFQADVPERFYMEGVSEAHIVGMASGLATTGKIVYVNTIATFLTRRCYEQNVIDLGLAEVPVRLIAGGGGLVYAPLGPTHLAIDDISIMRTIPGMTVFAPCDADEMEAAIRASVDYPGPIYFRSAKGGDAIVSDKSKKFVFGKGVLMRGSFKSEVSLVTTGVMAQYAVSAADELKKQGKDVSVFHCHTVKPLDAETLIEIAKNAKTLITIEEHVINGGLGSAVAEVLMDSGMAKNLNFKRMALPDHFPDEYGSQESLLRSAGISVEHITKIILNG